MFYVNHFQGKDKIKEETYIDLCSKQNTDSCWTLTTSEESSDSVCSDTEYDPTKEYSLDISSTDEDYWCVFLF